MSDIFVDIDERITPRQLAKRVEFIENVLYTSIQLYSAKKTKHGYHFIFKIKENLNDYEILIMQLLLGSDWRRELFGFRRIKHKNKYWNVLFNEKYIRQRNGRLRLISKEMDIPYFEKRYKRWKNENR